MFVVHFSFRSFGASAVALVLTCALAACGGGKKHGAQAPDTTTKPKVLQVKTSVLKVGSVDVQSAGPVKPIDTATGRAVLGVAQAYIDNAVFAPLKTGKVGAKYAAIFDPSVQGGATGADLRALTDLDAGKVTIKSTTATPVHLSTLEGPFGETIYLATDFNLDIKAAATTPLTIHRHIELTFAKRGASWLVTAYRVQAVRKAATKKTTTTTATGGTTP